MQMPDIDEIRTDAATETLLGDLHQAAHKVNEIRPISPDVIRQVQRDILGERVYASNAIEGNTCDLRETIAILKAGYAGIEPHRRREATEVINLGKAIQQLQALSKSDACDVEKLLALHRTLLTGINDDWAGRFRDSQVMVRGARRQPPDSSEMSELMDTLFDRLRRAGDVAPTVLASWVHWSIARIHPFFDGNGRIARLWQDLLLFHHGLTCAIIRPGDRRDYLDALAQADEGDFNSLVQFVTQRTMATLDKYLSAQQDADARSEWASTLIAETTARAAESRRLGYLRWARKAEEVRYAFEQCAALITRLSADVDIQFRPYDLIDEPAWEELRSGGSVSKNWFFRIHIQQRQRHVSYIFFWGKHFWSELDRPVDRGEPRVCLLVSESTTGRDAGRLAEGNVAFPTLREITVTDTSLIRKKWVPELEREEQDFEISATQIAQDFIQEVLLRKLPQLPV
jgi:Fic family protein